MIEVFGYKAYHGDMLVTEGDDKRLLTNRDFLYNPKEDCWYDSTDSKYPNNIVISTMPYVNIEKCGEHIDTWEDCDTISECIFGVVEVHEPARVEVCRCKKCGKIDISWTRSSKD